MLSLSEPQGAVEWGAAIFDTGLQEVPEWPEDNLFYLHHFLVILNPFMGTLDSSVNIIIYTAGDIKFRQALVRMFQCKRRSPTTKNIPLRSTTSEYTNVDSVSDY